MSLFETSKSKVPGQAAHSGAGDRVRVRLVGTGWGVGGVAALCLGWGVFGLTPEAAGIGFTFENVAQVANDYAPQLSFDVLAAGESSVHFVLHNSGPVPGRIKGISIQDLGGHLADPSMVQDRASVRFKSGGGAHLPSSIPFVEDLDFTVDGAARYGMDPGEWLILAFDAPLSQVLEDLDSQSLRIALHVGSISDSPGLGSADSQKFVNVSRDLPAAPRAGSSPVPDGGRALVMLGVSALGLVLLGKPTPRRV